MKSDSTHPDLAHADIGIVCALPIELGAFLDRCERVRKYSGGDFVFRGGFYNRIRIAVVQSGMGFPKARKATQALIDAHTPNWILSAGFAGALLPGMKIGDIVMADSIVDEHNHELSVDLRMPADPEKGLHVGRIVTADNMVRLISEKQMLAKKHHAIAVEMESLAVAQVCRDTKTRFLAVRAISDDLSVDLPPEVLSVVGSTGTMRLGAAIGSFWKRPGSVKDMWGLREKAHQAAGQLATFLDGIVTQLYEAKH
ncbi:MAG: 5'-methylthioadenosine nucleosidase [Planctomycetes bacterium]|nr:5'-methylthioadenosine nucleosidase [Planctomycetota bacterium]